MSTHFVARVQLHHEHRYADFHRAMERRGFARMIKSGKGVSYELPNGSYYFYGTTTADHLVDLATAAAGEVSSPAKVIVTEGASTWRGLDIK